MCRELGFFPVDQGFLDSSRSWGTFMIFTIAKHHLYYYLLNVVLYVGLLLNVKPYPGQ